MGVVHVEASELPDVKRVHLMEMSCRTQHNETTVEKKMGSWVYLDICTFLYADKIENIRGETARLRTLHTTQ